MNAKKGCAKHNGGDIFLQSIFLSRASQLERRNPFHLSSSPFFAENKSALNSKTHEVLLVPLKKDTISAKHVSPHPDTDSEHRIEYGNQRMSSVIRMTAACGGTGTTFRFARNVVTASSTALFPDLLTMDVLTTLPSFSIVSSTMGQL